MKTWLTPEQLKVINDSPKILLLLYDLNLLPEVVATHMRAAVDAERDRCAKIAEELDWYAPGIEERMKKASGFGVSSEGYEDGAGIIVAEEIRNSGSASNG